MVCILLPIVLTWTAKAKIELKQLLIPLSFAALMGGTNTIIGTSTNLVGPTPGSVACAQRTHTPLAAAEVQSLGGGWCLTPGLLAGVGVCWRYCP